MEQLARWFRFDENATTLGRDTVAGVTTFIVMSYIIFVNPSVLSETGMPFTGVLAATCVSAAAKPASPSAAASG